MNKDKVIEGLSELFAQHFSIGPQEIEILPASGSDRRYFRLASGQYRAIGAYNEQEAENMAFLEFSKSFRHLGLSVPAIYGQSLEQNIYLLEDLGDVQLFNYLHQQRASTGKAFPESCTIFYKEALKKLAYLQIKGAQEVDYNYCYPIKAFNQQSMLWDCNQFKYWYLQPTQTKFNESQLEQDFQTLSYFLMQADTEFFMFRDFQARNIMIHQNELYFIDYQGGRKGPLQYDVVSLLFQAKAALSNEVREELLDYYIDEASALCEIDSESFRNYYYGFALLRSMQVLGAYGFKGHYQRKAHFLSSIPYALKNIRWLIEQVKLPIEIPHLMTIFRELVKSIPESKKETTVDQRNPLRLHVSSFSYKKGVPKDKSGHGVGFVFDCRCIHNPGRYEEYKKLTGQDKDVQYFFWKDGEMELFLNSAFETVRQAVSKYLSRGFTDLGINFGCTGGQHRSVFAAESVVKFLKHNFDENLLDIRLEHRERAFW